jgi:tetratricopeptide (TPR) repeat protein
MKPPPNAGRSRSPLAPLACMATAASLAIAFTAPPARAEGPEAAQAVEKLADEAYAQHAAGKHAEAIGTYTKAYELSKAGAILFNIATIYDRDLHERALAMEYFRRYLQAPDAEAEFIQKATERLSVLRREAEEEESARGVLPPPPAPPAPARAEETPAAPTAPASWSPAPPRREAAVRGNDWRVIGIVVGGVGVASIGASLVLGLVAKAKNDDANTLCDASSCRAERGITLDHQASGYATAATVSFVAGAVLVGTGLTMYFVAPRSAVPSARIAIEPHVGPNGAGFRIQGSF